MELFDEEMLATQKNGNKKTATIILVIIIILLVLVTALIGVIFYLKQSSLTVTLNGAVNPNLKNILYFRDGDTSKPYIPIKQVASFLGYEAYNGNYTTKSEENNQCYVECEDEVAMFTLNSNLLYKTMPSEDTDYEYFYIDEPVIAMNNELYTTMDGIEKAFNVQFNYNVESKDINIYTMPYLINFYTPQITGYGYSEISEDFTNQKAVIDDMLVVANEKDRVGVIQASTGEVILEVKYQDINYLQHTSDFLVVDNDKMGIISSDKKTKVDIQYDSIDLMDYDAELYRVELDGRYGVIDFKGNTIINLDYEQIGIDASQFKQNDLKNGYILADTLIPVKQNKLWGFFDTSGNQKTECKYDNVGYVAANNQNGYSLVVVPDYNVIVVGKEKKYTLIDATGEEVWNFFPFDSVYINVSSGTTSYKMTYNSETLDLIEYLDRMGYGKNNNKNNINNSQNTTNTNTTTNETATDTNNQQNAQENSQNNENEEGQANTENAEQQNNGQEQENPEQQPQQ